MIAKKIPDDPYIARLRQMLARTHTCELEFVLNAESGGTPGLEFFTRAVNYHLCMTPWIESVFPLAGASVLEIGCGSGASTSAMAYRCTHIDSFDINTTALEEARDRLAAMGADNAALHYLDDNWALPDRIGDSRGRMQSRYDVVLLPAVLEHMQMNERLPVLDLIWDLLRTDGIMVVYDTPNRLHPFDMHSFRLPFYNWLPDDLALLYASHAPRREFAPILDAADNPMHTLYRLGRGVSYHEFDLAIGLGEFEVIQDSYSNLLTHRAINSGFEGMLAEALRQYAPHVPPCFSKEFLEFVARKRWHKVKLSARQGVADRLLDQVRPALVIEGSQGVLEYDLGGTTRGLVLVEVLRHPWSSTLEFSTEAGDVFHRENLTADFAMTQVLRVAVPEMAHRLRLKVTEQAGALGNEAWILGVGLAKPGAGA